MTEPDLSSLPSTQAAVVRTLGWLNGAVLASKRARQRAISIDGTPCARWAWLHLVAARQCLEFASDIVPLTHEALRAALLEQSTATWEDAKLWADISLRLERERERYLTE